MFKVTDAGVMQVRTEVELRINGSPAGLDQIKKIHQASMDQSLLDLSLLGYPGSYLCVEVSFAGEHLFGYHYADVKFVRIGGS